MRISFDTIGNRTRDLPACGPLFQPTNPREEVIVFGGNLYRGKSRRFISCQATAVNVRSWRLYSNYSNTWNALGQGCTNPGRQVARATERCTVTRNINGSCVWNLIHFNFLAARILRFPHKLLESLPPSFQWGVTGACEWNKSRVDGRGSRTKEFDCRDVWTLGSVLVLGATDRCGQEDGHQVPASCHLKGHTFEAAGLIGRLH